MCSRPLWNFTLVQMKFNTVSYPNISILKGFFDIFEELVFESHPNLGIILLNKIFQELTKFKRILTKVVLPM